MKKSGLFWLALSLLILSMFLNMAGSSFIKHYFPDAPILNDIILDNLPYYKIGFLYHIFTITGLVVFALFALKHKSKIPYFLLLFSFAQFIRAFFIILTPFGTPYMLYGYPYETSIPLLGAGVYPSGHTGTLFLAFLMASGTYKIILAVLTIALIASLLLGRGHYSIDIFSGIIFSYAIYLFGEKYTPPFISDGKPERVIV